MSLAKLGFLAVLATAVAHTPQVASKVEMANRGDASYADRPFVGHSFVDHSFADRYFAQALPLPVQSNNPGVLSVGKILVASRNLDDPSFAQTVILLVHYDAGGVVGLILNRRTELPVSRVLGNYQAAKDRSDPVYFGGPVDSEKILVLRKSATKLTGATQICDGVYQIDTKAQLEQTLSDRTAPKAFHVYLGYAGWHADQLRKEMQLGAWFVFPGDAQTVFNPDPDSLWLQMIRKTELQIALNEPVDAN
jgi:putative AlgH/UPF0301 family transcriptional regulator